jgi:hypothetical protein
MIKLSAAIAGSLLMASQAGAVTINFDDLTAGTSVSNQYAGLGVTFSPNAFSGAGSSGSGQPWASNTDMTIASATGDVGALGSPSLVSGSLLHAYGLSGPGWLDEDGDPSFLISFAGAISSISIDFAGLGGALFAPDTRMFVYDGATLLGTVTASLPDSSVGQVTLSFAAPSITSVAVAPGSYDDWVGVDNVTFTAVVPEPATYGMMALGLALFGALRNRRQS